MKDKVAWCATVHRWSQTRLSNWTMMIVLFHRLMKQCYHSTNNWVFFLLLLLFNYTFWYHSYILASFSLFIFFTSLTRTLNDAKGNSSVENFNQEYLKISEISLLWDYDGTQPKGDLGWCHVTWSQLFCQPPCPDDHNQSTELHIEKFYLFSNVSER